MSTVAVSAILTFGKLINYYPSKIFRKNSEVFRRNTADRMNMDRILLFSPLFLNIAYMYIYTHICIDAHTHTHTY